MRKPKYRRHVGRDRGFVEFGGKRHYLPGPYKSPESLAAYRAFLRRNCPLVDDGTSVVYVATLGDRWLDWAENTYPANGSRGEYANCRAAVRHVVAVDPQTAITDYTPARLKALQSHLAAARKSRGYVNAVCARVRRMFRWGVGEGLVPPSAWHALTAVPGLRKGRTLAVERPPRAPVDWSTVAATLPQLSPTVAAMVLLQWHTGVRSQSVCLAKADQFRTDVQPWEWRPRHKTEATHELVVYVGPKAQRVLRPLLKSMGNTHTFLFAPVHGMTGKRAKGFRSFYDSVSYLRAISRACDRAGVPRWTPHQIRHAKATLVRAAYGLEAAQATTGHATLSAAQIYAHRAADLAKRVARETG